MEEQSIIKEKLQLELSLLSRDMENYYQMLLRRSEGPSFEKAIPLSEELLRDRVDKTLYFSSLFLAFKLKEGFKGETLEFEALWQILKHPFLKESFIQEKIAELSTLKEKISVLKSY
jgi:hypothetical protein